MARRKRAERDVLTGTGNGILNTMQPSLDQLIQICRTQVLDQEFVRIVLASTPGTYRTTPN